MNNYWIAKLFILLLISIPTTSYAHHSASNIDQNSEIVIEGEIVRYEWINPHVYIWVEQRVNNSELVTWEIEGQPPAVLRRLGWSKDTLKVGDHVVINGNPGRNPEERIALMRSLEKADATIPKFDRADISVSLAQTDTAIIEQSPGFSGNWATIVGPVYRKYFIGRSSLPLTEKGRAEVNSFVEIIDSPGVGCIPYTAPLVMLRRDIKLIEVLDDKIRILGEYDAIERVIYLNKETHEGATESIQGHSIGHWEDDVLVVDTTHFAPHQSGNAWSLPSGTEKHLVERFELNKERTSLLYSFVLEDPEYFSEPVDGVGVEWAYRPDFDYQPLLCDIGNARRFFEKSSGSE